MIQFWSLISFKIIVTAAMLIVGTILLVNQQINVGQFIAADIVIITIIGSVEKLIISLDKVYDALVSIEKLGKITEAETETGGNFLLENGDKGLSIQFRDVTFTYPNGNKIFSNISFNIEAGHLVHLNGNSGTGKSTLLRLLTGAYKNYEGIILINGQSIDNYNLKSLRNCTGVLLNNQDIFQGTLWENITMGNPDTTLEEVTDCINAFGLTSFVQSDKQGLDIVLDPVGKRLSKQTRQKILLTRALLGKHRLLLLEEPFEYLDEITAKTIMGYLKKLRHTTVLIACQDDFLSMEYDMTITLENK